MGFRHSPRPPASKEVDSTLYTVYKITNQKNGMCYVGVTSKSIEERINQHFHDAGRKKFQNRPLYKAMNEYGKDAFIVEKLELCNESNRNHCEKKWIKKLNSFNNGYNATTGGSGKPFIDRNKVYFLWNEGLSVGQIAERLSISKDGVSYHLSRMGITSQERIVRNPHVNVLKKSVVQLNVDGSIQNVFESTCEAYRYIGKEQSNHISDVCNGKRKTAYGFTWKWLKDIEV